MTDERRESVTLWAHQTLAEGTALRLPSSHNPAPWPSASSVQLSPSARALLLWAAQGGCAARRDSQQRRAGVAQSLRFQAAGPQQQGRLLSVKDVEMHEMHDTQKRYGTSKDTRSPCYSTLSVKLARLVTVIGKRQMSCKTPTSSSSRIFASFPKDRPFLLCYEWTIA